MSECKKCGESIVEGHAYELGDDRWHISCFKCFKCNKLLGCNLNFLVLGNGLLVCLACLYSCKQCGKKIDDLAILTGDQAYCLACFKCRVCKRKIEDLRYARTLKGLFCMSCHEELLARKKRHDLRRKHSQTSTGLYFDAHHNGSAAATPQSDASVKRTVSAHSDRHYLDLGSPFENDNLGMVHSLRALLSSINKQLPLPPDQAAEQNAQMAATQALRAIEEVNDSDDELNMRRMREELDRQFLGHDNNGAILDLIESFSAPNTPREEEEAEFYETRNASRDAYTGDPKSPLAQEASKLQQLQEAHRPQLDPENPPERTHVLQLPVHGAPALGQARLQQGLLGGSVATPQVLQGPVAGHPGRKSPGASTFLVPDLSSSDEVKIRSTALSPMAKANRQARVVESHDSISGPAIDTDLPHEQPPYATPKRTGGPFQMQLPPPRMALPDFPSPARPRREPEDYKGLGLDVASDPKKERDRSRPRDDRDGFEKERAGMFGTPTVTNLEETIDDDAEDHAEPLEPTKTPSRKQSMRNKLSHMHKRLISNGLSLLSKFGIFRSSDLPRGHARHVLDGSVAGQAFATPPLPSEFNGSAAFHVRLLLDTNYAGIADEAAQRDLELRLFKLELYSLDQRRQTLLTENMRLTLERQRAQEQLTLLHTQIQADQLAVDAEQAFLLEERSKLAADRAQLGEEWSRLNEQMRRVNEDRARMHDERARMQDELRQLREEVAALRAEGKGTHVSGLGSSYGGGSTLNGSHNGLIPTSGSSNTLHYADSELEGVLGAEEEGEQKATRLKFWRRPKVVNAPNGLAAHAGKQPDDAFGRKALNSIMKLRLTTVLDTLLECPLLTLSLQRRATFEGEKVPLIVLRCLEEVERRGLNVEGIYRLSGGNSAITAVEQAFATMPVKGQHEKKHTTRLNEALSGDINAVTLALKRYLRKLPDPLIPFALYDAFIAIGGGAMSPGDAADELAGRVVAKLPQANKHAMFLIGRHLDTVNRHSATNRMNFKNLLVVFAPTIARDPTGEREMVDMAARNEATEMFFTNFWRVFKDYEE